MAGTKYYSALLLRGITVLAVMIAAPATITMVGGSATVTQSSPGDIVGSQHNHGLVSSASNTNNKKITILNRSSDVSRGDIVRIEAQLNNSANGSMTITSFDGNYSVTINLNDGNDDGRITILFNTYSGNVSQAFRAINGNDEVAVSRYATNRRRPLDTGRYVITASVDGRVTSTETFELTSRSVDSIEVYTAPQGMNGIFNSTHSVIDAKQSGSLTPDRAIAHRDYVVIAAKVDGIDGAFNSSAESSTEATFLKLLQRGQLSLSMQQTNADTDTLQKRLNVSRLSASDIEVVRNSPNGSLYIAFDTADTFLYQSQNVTSVYSTDINESVPAGPKDRFEVSVEFEHTNNTARTTYRIVPRTVQIDTNTQINRTSGIAVRRDADQAITGQTSVAPGTRLSVRVSRNENPVFSKANTARVQTDGEFKSSFDFGAIPQETTFSVHVNGGEFVNSLSVSGIVATNPTGKISISSQRTSQDVVSVPSAVLSQGGFIAVYNGSFDIQSDSPLGVSGYLEPGEHRDTSILIDGINNGSHEVVVVAHVDTNRNRNFDYTKSSGASDGPYLTGNDTPVSREITITIRMTPSGTTTDSATSPEIANTEETTSRRSASDATNSDGQSGFTTVLSFISGMIVFILLTRRLCSY